MIEQGSDAWFAERLGKITASRIKDVIAKTKAGYSTSRKNYAAQLLLERVLGIREETYVNAAMQRGTDEEPLARAAYAEAMALDYVEEVSFITHPTIMSSGASPDGLVGTDGMLEIKNPNTATHIGWAVAGKVPPEHIPQMAWQLACSGRRWCDFVSYDSRMPEGQQLFIRRYHRDDKVIKDLEEEVIAFDKEIEAMAASCDGVTWIDLSQKEQ
jgi:putative phage-type endonuclease